MGKRGRKPLSIEQLERRGSWRGTRQRKDQQAEPKGPKRKIPPAVEPESLLELIKQIPNYDPYKGAEDYYFEPEAAAEAIDFFQQKLTHVKGEKAGEAFLLEDWEQAIIANLFGWLNKVTGFRRFKEAFIEVARKNGKTPLAAGIILYMLFMDEEPGAEIYGAASEYKQASLVFIHAQGMVRQEVTLAEGCKIFKGQSKAIEIGEPGDPNYGVYRVISSDSFSAHGFNTHAGVVDELHTQPDSKLVDALLTSVAARRQPLICYITTSDFEREGSVCNEKEDYALKVSSGIIEDLSFLPVIYQADRDDDWTSEEVWRKANPNLGVSVPLDFLQHECKRAQESVAYENTFKRLHLNIRTQQDVRWLGMDKWDACNGPVDAEALVGAECLGGLDMSTTTDLSAFVLVFRRDGMIYVLPFFWLPEKAAYRRHRKDKVPYPVWVKQGYIRATKGDVIDYDVVRNDINELGTRYNIKDIAIDRWNSTQIMTQLDGDGFEMVPFGQGYASMSAPSKELEKLIIQGGLQHGGHPVLRWMASNVAAELDAAGNIKPSKKKSTERIDGIVALIMAIGRLIAQPESRPSIYETQEPMVL